MDYYRITRKNLIEDLKGLSDESLDLVISQATSERETRQYRKELFTWLPRIRKLEAVKNMKAKRAANLNVKRSG